MISNIKIGAAFIFQYFLLYFVAGLTIIAIVFGVHMLADALIPESDGGPFPSLMEIGLKPVIVATAIGAACVGLWKGYRDFVVSPRIQRLAFSRPPLSQLQALGFVSDGDYFKRSEKGYLVLVTFYWIDAFKPKGNYVVGVLYDHEHLDPEQRQNKSAALERKYKNHEPAVLFFENFAYQFFPQDEDQPVELQALLDFKDKVIAILANEGAPRFSLAKTDEAMAGKLTTVFAELDGLI